MEKARLQESVLALIRQHPRGLTTSNDQVIGLVALSDGAFKLERAKNYVVLDILPSGRLVDTGILREDNHYTVWLQRIELLIAQASA